ncbi:hypothetical protein [Fundidesulfovibrio soli]|uniref:hypothetical protein n=1 Tax=Fundidesulfovibrio soli TaxID=2922716 RepID=UPI001FAF6CA1|nr:hypothetical protein [Fundidesulfovibrio soli]
MRTVAFILFAVVTAAAAALSTLVATRYLTLEKDVLEARSHLESISMERKRQEEEKMALRLDRERIQSELEARLAEQKNQLDDCTALRLNDLEDLRASMLNLNKRLTDMQNQLSASATREGHSDAPQPGAQPPAAPSASQAGGAPAPASSTDVPKGAIPTPEQEAKKLDKAQ